MEILEVLDKLFEKASEEKLPDIHLNTNHLPILRWKNGKLFSVEVLEWLREWEDIKLFPLSKFDLEEILEKIIWKAWVKKFEEEKELDSSYKSLTWDTYRVNCYYDINWANIALRLIPKEIPSLETLWLWWKIKELCSKEKWIILVTWPTWSWKSTNLAAMIDFINNNFEKHIITIEDPVEFVFKSNKSLINQRELWNSTFGFKQAMKSVLREDPDIIMVWEMRDPETIKTAITLAETGHLVLSTLHTNDSVQTIDRIIDVFPSNQQKQIRLQLAMSLVWVISQRLLPKKDDSWRIPAREILINNDAVRNLIITWKTHQLYSVLEVWQKEGMILMDRYLQALYEKWLIEKKVMLNFARDRESLEML